MSNYKNISITIGLYVISLIISLTGISLSHSIDINNYITALFIAFFLLVGVGFSLKSNKQKESSWLGSLLGVIGIIGTILVFLAAYLSSMQ